MAGRSLTNVNRRGLVAASGAALITPLSTGPVQAQTERARVEDALAEMRELAIGANLAANINFTPAGTGTTERSAQEKLREIVSVKDYGAIGDGTSRALGTAFPSLAAARAVYPFVSSLAQTRDWAGIMQALSQARSIHIPAGTYRCGGDEITVTRPTRITGDGPHLSIITRSTSGNGLNLSMAETSAAGSYDNRIDGIALVNTMRDGTSTSGAGISGRYSYFSEITNVRITNFYDGIHLVQCPASNIRGLNITTFTRYGFASDGSFGFDCRITDFVISGQRLVDGVQTVYGSKGIFLADMNDEFVFLNGIVNFCSVGLYTDAATFTINACPEFCRFINVSFDSNFVGIDLANCADLVFQACFVSNRPGTGAVIGQRGPTRNIQFFGCTFQTNGSNGATLFSNSKFTNFTGCNIQSNSASAGAGISHGVAVLAGTTDFAFINCHFDNGWGSGSQNFGLYITDEACDRFAVIGNYFSTSTGGMFINESKGVDQNIIGNIGYSTEVQGSSTYDPPSLDDGEGATTTVRVNGAALGDFVVGVSFSNDLKGVTVTGWVSAPDAVTARFQNATGAKVELAAGTLRARVSKF